MNVTNLPYNYLLSCPLRLLLDDTAIVWGYRALAKALFVTYDFLSRASFFTFNPYYEGRRYTKFCPFLSRLFFFGGTMRLGLVRRCWLIKFIVAILANNPPKYALE